MLREQALTEWTSLKAKVNALKLSEEDKKICDFLRKSIFSKPFTQVSDMDLTVLAEQLEKATERVEQFEPENDSIIEWWICIRFSSSQFIEDWIEQKRAIIQLENNQDRLDNMIMAVRAVLTSRLRDIEIEKKDSQNENLQVSYLTLVASEERLVNELKEILDGIIIEAVD